MIGLKTRQAKPLPHRGVKRVARGPGPSCDQRDRDGTRTRDFHRDRVALYSSELHGQ